MSAARTLRAHHRMREAGPDSHPSQGVAIKYLVTAKPGPIPPPPDLVRQAQEWIQAKLSDGLSN